ncbi:NnrU family protein [Octadecabacter sp. CECT 8868]|uniref:NnrU family protein n=1 Tax=Octadecabacter algicola TaxID=2909342 RepID=UPI001F45E7A4|nr:NnrU family protein [Octadecabacter algicola]MCF2904676.1 NnrU family protein [Octadecabacter algicola]
MGWASFGLAFFVFFLSHSIPVRPPLRPWLIARLGTTGFTLIYSAMSLAVLVWLIVEAGGAPFVPIWNWAPWQSYVPLIVMFPVCIIITLSAGQPNPFSFGGAHNERFDPQAPGIVRFTRHPFLLALALWALAHIVPNGDLAHVLLFGTFAVFAILGRKIIDKRKKHALGAEWATLVQALRDRPVLLGNFSGLSKIRLMVGVFFYLALLAAHPAFISVSPMP